MVPTVKLSTNNHINHSGQRFSHIYTCPESYNVPNTDSRVQCTDGHKTASPDMIVKATSHKSTQSRYK